MFAGHLQAGYIGVNVEDNRAFLLPYDPLESGPVFGLDLDYLTPSFGSLSLESAYRGSEDWDATLDYGHAAAVDVNVQTRKFTHARSHSELPEDYDVLNLLIPAGEFIGESHDANPDAEYSDTLSDTRAAVKVRVPGYPAHLSASGRVYRHQGSQQMVYFFRSCSTEVCHVKSETRTLDQVTEEYTLGVDAHAGPVDIAYSRTFLTFRDDARRPGRRLRRSHLHPGAVLAGRRLRPRRQPRPAVVQGLRQAQHEPGQPRRRLPGLRPPGAGERDERHHQGRPARRSRRQLSRGPATLRGRSTHLRRGADARSFRVGAGDPGQGHRIPHQERPDALP